MSQILCPNETNGIYQHGCLMELHFVAGAVGVVNIIFCGMSTIIFIVVVTLIATVTNCQIIARAITKQAIVIVYKYSHSALFKYLK